MIFVLSFIKFLIANKTNSSEGQLHLDLVLHICSYNDYISI